MPLQFRTIGLIIRPEARASKTVATLLSHLQSIGCTIKLEQETAEEISGYEALPREQLGDTVDLVITVGGDGILLGAARILADKAVPLLGINLGRLGFLADISITGMTKDLDQILAGNYDAEERFLLQTQILRDEEVVNSNLSFNDTVIHKWNTARLIEFETFVNHRFVDIQRSDGMIISTPTGSTAYALSGGGPLMEPDLDALLMVPICPHRLSNRPIVIGGDSVIDIKVCGRTVPENVRVSCDGQEEMEIRENEIIRINRYPKYIRLIHPRGHDHFDIMRAKLDWGEHPSQ